MAKDSVLGKITLLGSSNKDVAFAIGVILILSVLLLPLPVLLIDLSLAFSFSISVLILMVALWIGRSADFSSFPTILLVVTLLRMALNIATTRAILSNGHEGTHAAGAVIQGFSNFIMGGNFVIGMIIFAILVVVNFVVITKGSTRIAEVSARFTLDAIPGKQMAIDADLAAGIITDKEAKERRLDLEQESSFYGAMDGASKFVRGDAIAGIIITGINLVGGIIIGVLQHGMPFGEAASTFSILSVGDGLVSQIPALLVSLAAGLIISKGANKGSAEKVVLAQLGAYPKALFVSAGLLVVLGIAPGLPFVPFFVLAASFTLIGWFVPRVLARQELEQQAVESVVEEPKTAEETVRDKLRLEEVVLEIGAALVPMISSGKRDLADKLKTLRGRFASEYGVVLPMINIKDSVDLGNNEYRLLIHGQESARGEVRASGKLVLSPDGGDIALPGQKVKDPTFGLPACWIDNGLSSEAEALGYTVVAPESVIVTHVAEAVKDFLPNLLTYAATERLIDQVIEPEYLKLVRDIIPSQISMVALQRVLQNLLAERVSIINLPLILESVAEACTWTRNILFITEHVRGKLAHQICNPLIDAQGYLPIISLSDHWDAELSKSFVGEGDQRKFSMPPSRVQSFLKEVRGKIQAHMEMDPTPTILVNPEIRPYVSELIRRISPSTHVISHAELSRKVTLRTVDVV